MDYLNNRILLSEALSCDRLPEEIWCSQQILGLYEVWKSDFRGKLSHIGPDPETEGLYCFYFTTLKFERKKPKTGMVRWQSPAEER